MKTDLRQLVDTSVVIAWMRGEVPSREVTLANARYFISAITVGELQVGVQLAKAAEREAARIFAMTYSMTVLAVDASTAALYTHAKSRLRTAGRMIPDNDLWIAASALEHKLPLVTRDAHFLRVEGLEGLEVILL